MQQQVEIRQLELAEFQRAVDIVLASPYFAEKEIKAFLPLTQLAHFEREFPDQMRLFRLVGIHPTESTHVLNPYTGQYSSESFSNIGEHCLAVAFCASKIAEALVNLGVLTTNQAREVTERALVHDINKPFEIMRRNACNGGPLNDVYSAAAYTELQPLLEQVGIPSDVSAYVAHAGAEAGHNSVVRFVAVGPKGFAGLVPGRLAEKIVHLADDMTFTDKGPHPTTLFMTCWERMLTSQFIVKYPFLWTKGLVADSEGSITTVEDVRRIPGGYTLLGSYAKLQVRIAFAISRELQLLLAPGNTEEPQSFIRRIVNSHCHR